MEHRVPIIRIGKKIKGRGAGERRKNKGAWLSEGGLSVGSWIAKEVPVWHSLRQMTVERRWNAGLVENTNPDKKWSRWPIFLFRFPYD